MTGDGHIELWDNDGIVNTASMLWPDGENAVLVLADHIDIVGHYKLVPVAGWTTDSESANQGRRYQSYDLLKSTSGFVDETFTQVWNDVFDFCAASSGAQS